MDSVQALCWVLLIAGVAKGHAAGPTPTPLSSGPNRRFDHGATDDFFSAHKDLLTPPKDLLETPKDLTETPEDLVDTPEDLVETPKDLLEEHRGSDDFEEFAKYGKEAAQVLAESDFPEGDGHEGAGPESQRQGESGAHEDLTDLSYAKHLQDSENDGHQPFKNSYPGHPPGGTSSTASSGRHAPLRTSSGSSQEGAPPARTTYHGHHSGQVGNLEYEADHGEQHGAQPEYAYRYGVNDPNTKDVKSAWELREGENTRGGYSVVEPDGHTRVVEYTVSKHGGFNARVKHLPPGY